MCSTHFQELLHIEFVQKTKLFKNLNIIEINIPDFYKFEINNPSDDPNKWHTESHAFCFEVNKWIVENGCDVIWSFFISDMFVRPHNIPVILNQSGYYCDDYIIRSTMFQMYDAVVCISTNVKFKWLQKLPIPFRKTFVLNSAPMVNFGDDYHRSFQEDFMVKNFEVLFVGRLIESKGIKELIEAFDIIYENYKNIHLTIVGSGPEKENLQKLIYKMGLDSAISMIGEVIDTSDYYKKADIGIFPSHSYEGFMNVVIEAMYYGLCVISTKGNGNEDIIEDNKNGILIDKSDPEIIAHEVMSLIKDSSKIKNISISARDSVLQKLTWSNVVGQMREIMADLMLQYKNHD